MMQNQNEMKQKIDELTSKIEQLEKNQLEVKTVIKEIDEYQEIEEIVEIVECDDNKIDEEGYKNIYRMWKNGDSSSDIYHIILDWINNNKYTVSCKKTLSFLDSILLRMKNNDSSTDIVQSFIDCDILNLKQFNRKEL